MADSAKHIAIDSSFLLEFICRELKDKRAISSKELPSDFSINNPWEHFTKIHKVANLIPSSFSHAVNGKKGMHGIYILPSSSFHYNDINTLLKEVVGKAKYNDVIPHLLQSRVRSHYTHSFLVGALGWWMLHNVRFEGNRLHDYYVEFIKKKYFGHGYDLWDIWWSVAMLHDVGYPVSLLLKRIELLCSYSYNYPEIGTADSAHVPDQAFLSDIIKSLLFSSFKGRLSSGLYSLLSFFFNSMKTKSSMSAYNFKKLKGKLFEEVHEEVIECLRVTAESIIRDDDSSGRESYRTKLKRYHASGCKLKKKREFVCQFDHGVMSTILAYQFVKEADRWKDDPFPALIFSPIAFHGLKSERGGSGKKITCEIKDDFDIFFLRLIDEMQEWHRGILSDKREEILIESERINLGNIIEGADGTKYIDLKTMEIVFEMGNIDALLKTGWSFKEFLNAKKSSFKLLELAGHKFEPKLKLEIV